MIEWRRDLLDAKKECLAYKVSRHEWMLGPEFWQTVRQAYGGGSGDGGGGGGGGKEPAGPDGFEDLVHERPRRILTTTRTRLPYGR
jgi:hypothetical protein